MHLFFVVFYRYNNEGNYTITVNASNDISYIVTDTDIKVQGVIGNCSLKKTVLDHNYSGNIKFDILAVHNYSNVHIDMQFGDGTSLYKFLPTMNDTSWLTLYHYYPVGTFEIKVNISNFVSNQYIAGEVMTEETITGLDVWASNYAVKPNDEVTLNIQTENGSNLLLNIKLNNIDFVNTSIANSFRGPTTHFHSLRVTNVGIYNISIIASNSISSQIVFLDKEIFVENLIQGLVVSTAHVISNPPGEIPMKIQYLNSIDAPSHLNCSTTISNLSIHNFYIAQMTIGKIEYISATWVNQNYIGGVQIDIQCTNKLSVLTFSTSTSLQQTISGISISADHDFVSTGGTIDFVFTIESGTKVSYTINFNDGISEQGNLIDKMLDNHQISKAHTFVQKGQYNIRFNVNNALSSLSDAKSIWVLERLEGLKVVRYFYLSDHSSDVSYGYGDDANIYPTERDITFDTTVVSGNNINYAWDFGNGDTLTTAEATISYKYKLDGEYTVIVNASNQLSFVVNSFVIRLYQTVLMSTLTNNGPTNAFEKITFSLQLSQPGTTSCYIWDVGDGSALTIYGEDNCQKTAESMNYRYINWQLSPTLIHTHMYRVNATYTVNVVGSNEISSKSLSSVAIISGISCFYPVVHIVGGGLSIDEPEKIQKSEWINLQSYAEVNCKVSQNVSYRWNIYKISQGDTYQDYTFQEYVLRNNVKLDHFNLLFPPRSFENGHYRISLNVSMTEIYGLSSEDFTYLNITPTPLHVKINGGNARVVGYNNILIMNAADDTYDPDIDNRNNKTGMLFIWRCRQASEKYDSTMPDIDIPEWSTYINMTRQDGCFGTGIGILPMNTPLFQVSTLYFEPQSENVFELEVIKDSRSSTYRQVVYIVEGDPPTLTIK